MGQFQLNARSLHHLLSSPLSPLPKLDRVGTPSQKAEIFSLGSHPLNVRNILRNVDVLESVVLLLARLKLEVVLILLGSCYLILVLKDDKPPRFVTEGKVLA
jgi:hypothetical protein